MGKTTIILVFVLASFLFLGGCGAMFVGGSYNTMVSNEEVVKQKWSQVENVYQRRSDLIPNLVNTVKGAANFEKSTLEGVIQARASATQVKVDASKLTPENIKNFQLAQDGLSNALSRLMVVSERYPELKANQNFVALMSEISGTENRISVERKGFNQVVELYNTYIRSFPSNLIAGWFGFQPKPYFEAAKGADKAPEVKF